MAEQLHYWQALNRALDVAMAADETVFALREDLGFGGSYRVTEGFYAKYGEWRVRDTPISEGAYALLPKAVSPFIYALSRMSASTNNPPVCE